MTENSINHTHTQDLVLGHFGEVSALPCFDICGNISYYCIRVSDEKFAATYEKDVVASVICGSLWFDLLCVGGAFAAKSAQIDLVLTASVNACQLAELQIWCRNRLLVRRYCSRDLENLSPRSLEDLSLLAVGFAAGFSKILCHTDHTRSNSTREAPYILIADSNEPDTPLKKMEGDIALQ